MKVVVTDFIQDALEPERRILGDLADVEALDAYDEDELVGRIEDADAVMLYHNLALSRRTIERLDHCKLIVRCGVGYDNVDHAFARQRGIAVANVPDYGTEEVADSAIGMMMALARGNRLSELAAAGRRSGRGITRRRCPSIGCAAGCSASSGWGGSARPRPCGRKRWAWTSPSTIPTSRTATTRPSACGACEQLDELLAQAHVLSLHCPLTEETRHMIDAAAMAKMPDGAYLINTARGGVVDTAAVPAAIASGRWPGRASTCWSTNRPRTTIRWWPPGATRQHPAHHRVLLNPHSAFYSEEGLMDMRIKGSEACRRATVRPADAQRGQLRLVHRCKEPLLR